ncbi:MAG: hypothetical protein IJM55_10815 [Ruminococcus sp.]|nr:hypothetical protein [Ruminococcus sp.]
MLIIKLALIAFALFVVFFAAQDFMANLKQLRESDTGSFAGIATPVSAVVSNKQRYDIRSGKGQGPAMANLNDFTLVYEVDGTTYTKAVGLLDKGSSLKDGDTVELMYDSADPSKAVMADGSEKESAKNGFKFDIGMVAAVCIIELIVFFVFLN